MRAVLDVNRRRRGRAALTAIAAVFTVPLALVAAASADTTPPPGLVTTVSTATQTNVAPNGPLTSLHDATALNISITATGASAGHFFGSDARLCKPGVNIASSAQFNPTTGGACVDAPLSAASDDFQTASAAPANQSVSFAFHVGVGTQTYTFRGGQSTITCGPGHPCTLWLREAVDTSLVISGTVWIHYDLTYAAPPVVTVTGLAPNALGRGAVKVVTFRGTGFTSGATVSFSGTGVTAGPTRFVSSTTLTATVTVKINAAPGARDVTITDPAGGGSGTCRACLSIHAGPIPTRASPNSLRRGAVNQAVTVTGTGFVSGIGATVSGAGATVTHVAFVSSTQLQVTITVASTATTGPRAVTVTNADGGTGSCAGCLTIT